MTKDQARAEIARIVSRFPKWREIIAFQRRMGSPYIGYRPEIKDLEAMMLLLEYYKDTEAS